MRISQREARRLRKRVDELEGQIDRQRKVWAQEYVHGAQIGSVNFDSGSVVPAVIRTARKLGHAVVCVGDDSNNVRLIALPHPKG